MLLRPRGALSCGHIGGQTVDELGIARKFRAPEMKFDPAVDSALPATYLSLRPKQLTGADPPEGFSKEALQGSDSSVSAGRPAAAATFGSTQSAEDPPVRGPLSGAGRSGLEGGCGRRREQRREGSPGPSSTLRGSRPPTESRRIRNAMSRATGHGALRRV
jgi:hypothetical protein